MTSPASLFDDLLAAGLSPQRDAPLAPRTWWQIGGPAEILVKAGTVAEVQAVARAAAAHGAPVFVLGNGTNLLVSDRGIPGIVLQLHRDLATAEADDDGPTPRIVAGAGTKLVVLLKKALRHGWTGLEVFAGIPGTVGGAVRMNAGARLGETARVLESVDLVLPDGSLRTVPAEDLGLAYRTAILPAGSIIVRATLRVLPGDPTEMRAHVDAHLAHRAATQPLDQPSCGSTFRNPPGDHAGRLIEAAGLKGHRIGDIQVSEKHANFLVNLGGATADDVRRLIEHIEATVHDRFGVALQREVHLAGDWSHWPGPP
jgi:UDP-N-acetylmuramate dehydrogenase